MGTHLFQCNDVQTNVFVLWPVHVVDGGLNVELLLELLCVVVFVCFFVLLL